MAGNGWQFSVTVPSWTQATLEGDENIVFYRVEVKVLPPEADAAPRTRSVLRRFSHFTKLYAKLKEELGNSKMAKLDPPSKNRLVGVNKRPDLVEKRRRDLESWLWKLIGDGDIARSRVLNNFLELSDAARLVQRAPPSAVPSRAASQTGSYAWSEGGSSRGFRGAQGGQGGPGGSEGGYAWSEGGSSSVHEGSSQQTGAAPLDVCSTGAEGLPPVPPSQLPLHRSASDSTQQLPDPAQGPPSDTPQDPPTMATSASTSAGISVASVPRTHQHPDARQPPMSRTGSMASEHPSHGQMFATAHTAIGASNFHTHSPESRMRLGLRVEQRVTVKHHVRALQQQLDRAAGDLQDAMEAIQTERHTKRQLAAQLADLQDRASESGVMQAVEREAELTTSLEQAHESSGQLQQQLTDLQAQLASVQSQLQDSRSAHAVSQQSLSATQELVTSLQTQLQQVQERLIESQQATAAALAALQESERAASSAAAGMSQGLSQSQQHVSSLQSQLERVTTQLEQSQQATAQAEFTYKDSHAAAAADASHHLAASRQQITQLMTELDAVRQQLLQSQAGAAQRPEEQSSKEPSVDTLLTASPSGSATDAPTVAPPTTASLDGQAQGAAEGLQSAEGVSKLQADKAASDDRLAAMMAELQAFKQEAADAEVKSRADRKVLAREVKALRKQLGTEKQQAAAKEAEHAAREAASEAEHTAREAEFAAKETELAAVLEAVSGARKNEYSSEEAELASTALARPGDTDAVEPEAPKEAEAAAAVPARPDVVEAVEHGAAKEAERASTSDTVGGGDVPHAAVLDTHAASDAAPSVQAPVSHKQLLQEVAALRQRLHDSSFEVVAGQSAAGYDIKPQAAMEMLSTCDGRLQALMAEANLLGEAVSSQGEVSPEDAELRQAFASTLIESGALRQQINALLRDKYEAEAHSKDVQSQQQTAPDMKGLFRKLPGMPFMAPHSNGATSHADEEAAKPVFGQGIGDRFAGFGDRFSKSFSRPQQ